MSKKFARQLGVLLGSSGSSSKSNTRKSYTRGVPRLSAVQKRAEGALFLHQEIEKRKEQNLGERIVEKKCKHCSTMIPSDAKFCPHCRMSQSMPTWAWLIILFVTLLVIIKCSIP